MYEMNHEIRYSDYKDYDTAKVTTVLELVQELAIRDSAAAGYGIERLRELGVAWLLKGFNLHFEHPISVHAPLCGFTGVQRNKASTSVRGSVITQNGKIAAKCVADWFLFDVNAGRPCRIPEEILESYDLHDFDDDFFSYKKPQSVADLSPNREIVVSNQDIDTNRHLNNLKSAEHLIDILPFEFFFSDMSVVYKKQAYLGDVLGLCSAKIEGGYYAALLDKDGKVCVEGNFTAE